MFKVTVLSVVLEEIISTLLFRKNALGLSGPTLNGHWKRIATPSHCLSDVQLLESITGFRSWCSECSCKSESIDEE